MVFVYHETLTQNLHVGELRKNMKIKIKYPVSEFKNWDPQIRKKKEPDSIYPSSSALTPSLALWRRTESSPPPAPLSLPFSQNFVVSPVFVTFSIVRTSNFVPYHYSSEPTSLPFNLSPPNDIYIYIYIYMSYRTANLQKLHFIYLFNKYTYWIF